MAEVRVSDLRFSTDETADFMQKALGSRLPDEALRVLAQKTEGWITSLRLAALTLRNKPDGDSRLAELHALERNRNLTDYLMSEVLAQAPANVADFLLKTAVLDRMCGPLCEALLGREDSELSSQSRLEWLEQNNLFTIPLDSEGPLVSLSPPPAQFPAEQVGAPAHCSRGRTAAHPGQCLVCPRGHAGGGVAARAAGA